MRLLIDLYIAKFKVPRNRVSEYSNNRMVLEYKDYDDDGSSSIMGIHIKFHLTILGFILEGFS